jgi:hypothetical protein
MRSKGETFKSDCIEKLGALEHFKWNGKALSEKQWAQAHDNFKALKLKSLYPVRIIQLLSEVLGTDVDTINACLQRKKLDRASKSSIKTTEAPLVRRKRPIEKDHDRKKEDQDPERQLIADANSITPKKRKKLEQYNVRITPLKKGAPVEGYEGIAVMHTPGKTPVYEVYKAETVTRGNLSSLSMFKKTTPIKNDRSKRGREKISSTEINEFKAQVPGLVSKQLQPLKYTVTAKDVLKATGKIRRFSQNALTGASCREVFEAYGAATFIKPKGSDYHWSHIRGLCIGGQHSAGHLFPATAASNYTTLLSVENAIINKLSEERDYPVKSIEVEVTPVYSKGSDVLIPETIKFKLTWKEKISDSLEFSHEETLNISARSNLPLTHNARAAINAMRETDGKEEITTDKQAEITEDPYKMP